MTEAAREGARLSVAGLTQAERTSLANQAVTNVLSRYQPWITSTSATITAAPATGNALLFSVTVTYPFTNYFQLLVPLTGNPTATVTVSNGGY